MSGRSEGLGRINEYAVATESKSCCSEYKILFITFVALLAIGAFVVGLLTLSGGSHPWFSGLNALGTAGGASFTAIGAVALIITILVACIIYRRENEDSRSLTPTPQKSIKTFSESEQEDSLKGEKQKDVISVTKSETEDQTSKNIKEQTPPEPRETGASKLAPLRFESKQENSIKEEKQKNVISVIKSEAEDQTSKNIKEQTPPEPRETGASKLAPLRFESEQENSIKDEKQKDVISVIKEEQGLLLSETLINEIFRKSATVTPDAIEPKDRVAFLDSIRKFGLISTLLAQSDPQIIQSFHLPGSDPAIEKAYNKKITEQWYNKTLGYVVQQVTYLEKFCQAQSITVRSAELLFRSVRSMQSFILGLLEIEYDWKAPGKSWHKVCVNQQDNFKLPAWFALFTTTNRLQPMSITKDLIKPNASKETITQAWENLEQLQEILRSLTKLKSC